MLCRCGSTGARAKWSSIFLFRFLEVGGRCMHQKTQFGSRGLPHPLFPYASRPARKVMGVWFLNSALFLERRRVRAAKQRSFG